MFRVLLITLIVIVLLLGASFGYFNAGSIEFDYLAGHVQMPLIGLLIADFALAVVLTLLVCFSRVFSLRAELRRMRKQLRDAEAELKNLREIPLKDV